MSNTFKSIIGDPLCETIDLGIDELSYRLKNENLDAQRMMEAFEEFIKKHGIKKTAELLEKNI